MFSFLSPLRHNTIIVIKSISSVDNTILFKCYIQHGVNYPSQFLLCMVIVFPRGNNYLLFKFVSFSQYLSLTQPQTCHQLRKYTLEMFHTSGIPSRSSPQRSLVWSLALNYAWCTHSQILFYPLQEYRSRHWPWWVCGSLPNVRTGRGIWGWLLLKFSNILRYFNSDTNILCLLMYFPCVPLLSSFQNLCTSLFPCFLKELGTNVEVCIRSAFENILEINVMENPDKYIK